MGLELDKVLYKGGTGPNSEPHQCPFSINGVTKAQCIEYSGRNAELNIGACCGTSRPGKDFAPCNFSMRRCWACLVSGRIGQNANPTTNVENGTCDDHAHVLLPSENARAASGGFSTEERRRRNQTRALSGGEWNTVAKHVPKGVRGDSGFIPKGPRVPIEYKAPTETIVEFANGDESADGAIDKTVYIQPTEPEKETVMTELSIADKKDLAAMVVALKPRSRELADAIAGGKSIAELVEHHGYPDSDSASKSRATLFGVLGLGGKVLSVDEKIKRLMSAYEYVSAAQADQKDGKRATKSSSKQMNGHHSVTPKVAPQSLANGNGHDVSELMQIDLARFGDLINFDLVPLDPENLAQRSKLIAERRKHGLKLETVLSHPSWPHQQMLFVQRSEE